MQINRRLEALLLSPLGLFLVATVVVPAVILFGYSLFAWHFLEPVGGTTLENSPTTRCSGPGVRAAPCSR
jgi:ABC-type sugar transport system permease subunit